MWKKGALYFPPRFSISSVRELPITISKCSSLQLKNNQKATFSSFETCDNTQFLQPTTYNKELKPFEVPSKNILQNCRCFSTATKTVDNDEISQFQTFGRMEWWDENGPVKALHTMNKLRIPLIRDGLINTNSVPNERSNYPKPLAGISVLDVGCGGGILSEPLAKLGAEVTGIDANPEIIEVANCHAKQNQLNINYCSMSIEDHVISNSDKYNAVVASEIVEHVTNKNEFIESCIKCLKPGGSIFVTTINKTMVANILAITVAENIGLVPKGTHQMDKFIEPHKLQRILEDNCCKTELIHGMFYNFLTNNWTWCSNTSISYAIHAIKL